MKSFNNPKLIWKGAAFIPMILVGSATAAPAIQSVSGNFIDNANMTITGSGFGAKNPAQPLVWDTFENGNVGGQILSSNATIGKWDSGGGYENLYYSDTIKYKGSKSGKAIFNQNIYNASLSKNGSFPTIYLDYKMYVRYYDNKSRNWKPWRFYGDNDQMQIDSVSLCGGPFNLSVIAGGETTGFSWGSLNYNNNNWYHSQVLYRSSDQNVNNGTVREYINGIVSNEHSNIITRKSTAHLNQIRVGHYWSTEGVSECPTANTGAEVYIDNIYIDTTWARVEIGNNQSWANSTQREIQIPTTWSNESITLSVNQGKFASGTTVYLFVHDSNGNVNSSGYPITIGGGVVNINLTPPANLTVEN